MVRDWSQTDHGVSRRPVHGREMVFLSNKSNLPIKKKSKYDLLITIVSVIIGILLAIIMIGVLASLEVSYIDPDVFTSTRISPIATRPFP